MASISRITNIPERGGRLLYLTAVIFGILLLAVNPYLFVAFVAAILVCYFVYEVIEE